MSTETEQLLPGQKPNARKIAYSREQITSELKTDFKFAQFYLYPGIFKGESWTTFLPLLEISTERGQEYATKLLETGLWLETPEGLQVAVSALDLGDLKVSEFLSMSLSVISQMTESGPCWYDSFVVVTNEKIKKEFYKEINQAFARLLEKSAQVQGDRILAWNHSALDGFKAMNKKMENSQ